MYNQVTINGQKKEEGVRIGDIFSIFLEFGYGEDRRFYILSQVEPFRYNFIGLSDGNRFTESQDSISALINRVKACGFTVEKVCDRGKCRINIDIIN